MKGWKIKTANEVGLETRIKSSLKSYLFLSRPTKLRIIEKTLLK